MRISKRSSLLLVISLMSLVSCSESLPSIDKKITVTFVDNDAVSFSSKTFKVEKGKNLTTSFSINEGYYFKSCSYADYTYETIDSTINITLKNIKYNTRVSLGTPLLGGMIYYRLNGGSFLDTTKTGNSYSLPFEERTYRRPNLDIGTSTIYREGYELTGWNTKEDGSGEHIGLGSRATMRSDAPNVFYAEWVKDNDLSDFEYEDSEDGTSIVLTKFNGELEGDKLVIPSDIEGKKVTKISSYFAKNLNYKTLYLPPYLSTVSNRAFIESHFDEMYLFDGITEMRDLAFSNVIIPIWHINAIQVPQYGTSRLICELPNDFDRLILKGDKKRIVLAGGCSLSYGIKTPVMQKNFDDYTIVNTGVIGEIGPIPVFGALAHYLKEGDILVHTPEQASENEFLYTVKAESRTFACFQLNYDLLSYCDMSKMTSVYSSFAACNAANPDFEYRDGYDYVSPMYNEYGEIQEARPDLRNDEGFSDGEYTYYPYLINDDTGALLRREYKMVEDAGADVVFSHAPMNKSNLSKDDIANKVWETFENNCKEQFDPYGYDVISDIETYLYNGRYFYDEDYHLNDIGAEMRSESLSKDILAYLGK